MGKLLQGGPLRYYNPGTSAMPVREDQDILFSAAGMGPNVVQDSQIPAHLSNNDNIRPAVFHASMVKCALIRTDTRIVQLLLERRSHSLAGFNRSQFSDGRPKNWVGQKGASEDASTAS